MTSSGTALHNLRGCHTLCTAGGAIHIEHRLLKSPEAVDHASPDQVRERVLKEDIKLQAIKTKSNKADYIKIRNVILILHLDLNPNKNKLKKG